MFERVVADDVFTVCVECFEFDFVDDDFDVVAHLLSCKSTACNDFEMAFVSADHSAFVKFDRDVGARRAVVNLVFDVKVVFDERNDFLRDFHRADDFVVFDDSASDRTDGVVTFGSVVSRAVNLIVCKQGFVSAFNHHFEAADEHVVHFVFGDVSIGFAVS